MPKPQLSSQWLTALEEEFGQNYMLELKEFLLNQKKQGKTIYPPNKQIFNALNTTDLNQVKVVILGQDPYHGPNQAHGLSFSVPQGIKPPPSLCNIFQELHADLGTPNSKNGDLTAWAKQGVLLLNSVLTVEKNLAASHAGKGWEKFTDKVISILNQKKHLVFILWGSYAQKKGSLIDNQKHLILKSPHPSPLSAHRGFLGSKHFSRTNEYLTMCDQTPIDWSIK